MRIFEGKEAVGRRYDYKSYWSIMRTSRAEAEWVAKWLNVNDDEWTYKLVELEPGTYRFDVYAGPNLLGYL